MYLPTYHLVLVTRYKRKDGKFPLKVRIGFERKSKDYLTKLYLTDEEYNEVVLPKPNKKYQTLKIKYDVLNARLTDTMNSIENFSYQAFEDKFFNGVRKPSDVYTVFDELIKNLGETGHYSNSVVYTTAKNSLMSFRKTLNFYDITVDFLNKYHKHMVAEKKSPTTISIYVRCLKAIINYSLDKKYIKKDFDYPFGKRKYQIPAGRNIKKALSKTTMESLRNFKPIPYTQLDKGKDFFFFSYLCNGMNVNDIITLKWSNIDGKMLRYVRGKTKNTAQSNRIIISVPLGETLLDTIKKWSVASSDVDDFIFDIISKTDTEEQVFKKKGLFTANLNRWLRNIKEELKLIEEITMIHARHTAATTLKRGGVDRQKISESLGHTNLNTTNHYLDSFDDDSKEEIMQILLDF